MITFHLVALIAAFVLFLIAAFDPFPMNPPRRLNFGWLGLACLTFALWLH